MGNRYVTVAIVLAAVSLVGCERWNSIFRHENMSGSQTLVTDAKQRIVTSTEIQTSPFLGRIKPHRVICAESSPDVAQAISQSMASSLQAAIEKANVTASGAAQFTGATTASIAQLGERLGTIQLLRDKLYRACEAYANGAVSATVYTIMLSRLDKTMVTLLQSEMAAGAFGRQLASAGGTSQGSTMPAAGMEDLNKARAEVTEAAENVKTRTNEFDKAPGAEKENAKKRLEQAEKELVVKELALLSLERAYARSVASSSAASGVGTIAGNQCCPTDAAEDIVTLQRQYLDSNETATLLDACITSMDVAREPREDEVVTIAQLGQRNLSARLQALKDPSEQNKAAFAAAKNELAKNEAPLLSPLGTWCRTQGFSDIKDLLTITSG